MQTQGSTILYKVFIHSADHICPSGSYNHILTAAVSHDLKHWNINILIFNNFLMGCDNQKALAMFFSTFFPQVSSWNIAGSFKGKAGVDRKASFLAFLTFHRVSFKSSSMDNKSYYLWPCCTLEECMRHVTDLPSIFVAVPQCSLLLETAALNTHL